MKYNVQKTFKVEQEKQDIGAKQMKPSKSKMYGHFPPKKTGAPTKVQNSR